MCPKGELSNSPLASGYLGPAAACAPAHHTQQLPLALALEGGLLALVLLGLQHHNERHIVLEQPVEGRLFGGRGAQGLREREGRLVELHLVLLDQGEARLPEERGAPVDGIRRPGVHLEEGGARAVRTQPGGQRRGACSGSQRTENIDTWTETMAHSLPWLAQQSRREGVMRWLFADLAHLAGLFLVHGRIPVLFELGGKEVLIVIALHLQCKRGPGVSPA